MYYITVNKHTNKVTGVWEGNPKGIMEIVNGLWEATFLDGRIHDISFGFRQLTEIEKDNFVIAPVTLQSNSIDYNELIELATELLNTERIECTV